RISVRQRGAAIRCGTRTGRALEQAGSDAYILRVAEDSQRAAVRCGALRCRRLRRGERRGSDQPRGSDMSALPKSTLGRTGLEVTKLGYGAMELRGIEHFPRLSATEASALLNDVLDSGVNYIDTSPDYGYSEELIGRHLAPRRGEFYLASKCGCPIEAPDVRFEDRKPHNFTRENIRAGVEQSLERMKTDYLDVVQFHLSPSRAVLEENDSVAELEALRKEGKVRFIGMSGTMPELEEHIEMGVFDVFQVPYSVVEREHEELIREAAGRGAGIVIRGGVAR